VQNPTVSLGERDTGDCVASVGFTPAVLEPDLTDGRLEIDMLHPIPALPKKNGAVMGVFLELPILEHREWLLQR
jgi:hypothetical protein